MEINGRVGSLQLMVNPTEYLAFKIVDHEAPADHADEAWKNLTKSDDYMKIALFDFMLLLSDRNTKNWLIKCKETNGGLGYDIDTGSANPAAIAIDHGDCMDIDDYLHFQLDGPSKYLTKFQDKPIQTKIPDHLTELLRSGLSRREKFAETLSGLLKEDIAEEKISYMWQRVKALIETGYFLSLMNMGYLNNQLPENSKEDPPHPPFKIMINNEFISGK